MTGSEKYHPGMLATYRDMTWTSHPAERSGSFVVATP